MKFSPLIPGFIFIFPPLLILIHYIFRVKKIMKKNNLNIVDLFDDEKSKIFKKEMRKTYHYYLLIILMGLVLAYVVAIINKQ